MTISGTDFAHSRALMLAGVITDLAHKLMRDRQHLNTEIRIATQAGRADYAASLMVEGRELDRLIDETKAFAIRIASHA